MDVDIIFALFGAACAVVGALAHALVVNHDVRIAARRRLDLIDAQKKLSRIAKQRDDAKAALRDISASVTANAAPAAKKLGRMADSALNKL